LPGRISARIGGHHRFFRKRGLREAGMDYDGNAVPSFRRLKKEPDAVL